MRLSVVIPCHNAAPYIGQAIGSLFEQTRPPDEIIVVDDRSTDGSGELVQRFGARVKLYQGDFGIAGRTRNAGAARSTGDAIMFLDADDVLGPDALAALERALESQPDGVALCPWFRLEQTAEGWVRRAPSVPDQRPPRDLLSGWLTGWYYPPCAVLWSRAAFSRIGGWQEVYNANDDGDLMMRALVDGIPMVRTRHGSAFYRRVPANASFSGERFTTRGVASRLRVLEKVQAWLEERGQLERYQADLAVAYGQTAAECAQAGEPALQQRCEQLRARCLPGARWQNTRRHLAGWRRGGAHLGRQVKRRLAQRLRRPAAPQPVAYGLQTARQASVAPVPRERPGPVERERPKVSVIIPTYNRATLVCRALRSVLAQTFGDLEVLVVDDASTDHTAEAVAALADPRIRYLRQPVNRDVSAARNRGLREARGDYIAFLDSDDEWLPQKLERQVALFEQLPEDVGLVYAGGELVAASGEQEIFVPEHRGHVLRPLLLKNITSSGSASVVIRRDVVRTVGFFDEQIAAMEDYDYWIRVARFYRFDFVREPLVRYYDVDLSDRRSLVREDDIQARERLYKKYYRLLRQEGLVHAFLVTSAQRRLYRIHPVDRPGALLLAVRALLAKPTAAEPYRIVTQTLVPDRVRQLARQRLRPRRRGISAPAGPAPRRRSAG